MSNVGRAFAMAAERGKKDSGKWWQKALVYAAAPQIVGLGVEAVKEGGKALFLGQNSKDLFSTTRGQNLLTDVNAINNLKTKRARDEANMLRTHDTIKDYMVSQQEKQLRSVMEKKLSGVTKSQFEYEFNNILSKKRDEFAQKAAEFQTNWYADTDKYATVPTVKEARANLEAGEGFYSKGGIGRFMTMARHGFDKEDLNLQKDLSLMETFYGPSYKNYTVEQFKNTLKGYGEDINELRSGNPTLSYNAMERAINEAANDKQFPQFSAAVARQARYNNANDHYRKLKFQIANRPNLSQSLKNHINDVKDFEIVKRLSNYNVDAENFGALVENELINNYYALKGPQAAKDATSPSAIKGMFTAQSFKNSANQFNKLTESVVATEKYPNKNELLDNQYSKGKENKDVSALLKQLKELKVNHQGIIGKNFVADFTDVIEDNNLNINTALSSGGIANLAEQYFANEINFNLMLGSDGKLVYRNNSEEANAPVRRDFILSKIGTKQQRQQIMDSTTGQHEFRSVVNNDRKMRANEETYGIERKFFKHRKAMVKTVLDAVPEDSSNDQKVRLVNAYMSRIITREAELADGKPFHMNLYNGLVTLEMDVRKDLGLPSIPVSQKVIKQYQMLDQDERPKYLVNLQELQENHGGEDESTIRKAYDAVVLYASDNPADAAFLAAGGIAMIPLTATAGLVGTAGAGTLMLGRTILTLGGKFKTGKHLVDFAKRLPTYGKKLVTKEKVLGTRDGVDVTKTVFDPVKTARVITGSAAGAKTYSLLSKDEEEN
jgi:hypothetical protein